MNVCVRNTGRPKCHKVHCNTKLVLFITADVRANELAITNLTSGLNLEPVGQMLSNPVVMSQIAYHWIL